ncbi:MAG: serine O-acetyltransferase [Jatrophihabitans sp.]|uniref:serine O-acetyltransferase n=1 Tax=Jatrophihabitans sp. TaxID=1932789 RepID=UPI003913FEA2
MSRPRPSDELSLLKLVRADIEATTHPNFRRYSTGRFWRRAFFKLLFSPNVRVVITYRVGHWLAQHGLLPVALILRTHGIRKSGAELNPLAKIGPGLYLAHSVGVGVGAYVEIGANCTLHLGSVIGPQTHGGGGPQRTVIGDDVFIGTHAVVVGGVTIGDGAVIGANAVVMRDVEPYTVVSASPARTVGQRSVS